MQLDSTTSELDAWSRDTTGASPIEGMQEPAALDELSALEDAIERFGEELNVADRDRARAHADLGKLLEQHQQLLDKMSSISKALSALTENAILKISHGGGEDEGMTSAEPATLECGTRQVYPGCDELNGSAESLNRQVGAAAETQEAVATTIAKLEDWKPGSEEIRAVVGDDALQNLAEAFELLSNASRRQHAAAMRAIANLKG